MSQALQFGPLVIPYTLLLALAVAFTGVLVGKRLGRKTDIDVENVVWKALFVGVVVARLAFVYEFRSVYLSSPLDIVDVRDGGWTPWVGAVGAWLFAFRQTTRMPALKMVACFPVKIKGASAGWTRAVAIIEE